MRTIADVTNWLYTLSVRAIKLGLERMEEVLRRVGDPQKQFVPIYIGGTNAKGSTCAFSARLLLAAG